MIEVSKLNTIFIQSCGSCVLASYAVVGNYFTGFPIEQFFEDYCRHFNQSFNTWQEAERIYANHFDLEWKIRKCEGYKVLLNLHNNSQEAVFERSRKIFSATFYTDSLNVLSKLEKKLENEKSFLNITFEVYANVCHSVTAFYDKENLLCRDTRFPGVVPIASLMGLGKLRDSVLYSKIEQ